MMSSRKCTNCGLVMFASVRQCKRCAQSMVPFAATTLAAPLQPLPANCPRCESSDTRSFPMVHVSGTSLARNAQGVLFEQQTTLASHVTPPFRPRASHTFALIAGFAALTIATILGILVSSILGSIIDPAKLTAPFLLFIAASAGASLFAGNKLDLRTHETNMIGYRSALDKWQRSWLCLRCGSNWLV